MLTRRERTPLRKLMLLGAMAGAGALVEDTATGNPLTFITDKAKPLKSLLIPFTPVQSGTGDPSPENIRSILPWDGLSVGRINGTAPVISNNAGMENVNGEWKNTGTDTKTVFDAYIQLYKNGTYIKNASIKQISEPGVYSMTFAVDDENCNRIVLVHSGRTNNLSVRFPFSLSLGTYTVNFEVVSANPSVVGGLAIKDIFFVAGGDVQRTETDIPFASPVYGGTLDVVSGVMTVEYIGSVFKWSEGKNETAYENVKRRRFDFSGSGGIITGSANSICNIAKYNANISLDEPHFYKVSGASGYYVYLPINTDKNTEIILCGKLATPVEIQLTPQQITALLGQNTIWSDADGQMTAVYLKKG